MFQLCFMFEKVIFFSIFLLEFFDIKIEFVYERISIMPYMFRIDFNFHKGGDDDDDMPLHLSIRFDEGLFRGAIFDFITLFFTGIFSGKVVYNTFENGNWSEDEKRISSPYKADELFDIRVRIRGGKYQIFGNRREIGTFDQRLPLDEVLFLF